MILLTGGGSLGDIWFRHQEFRQRVLSDFPNHRMIQLSQAIFFRNERMALERLEYGIRLLSRARLIVTHCLHILSVLLGIPHVCFDTGYRKIPGFYHLLSSLDEKLSQRSVCRIR